MVNYICSILASAPLPPAPVIWCAVTFSARLSQPELSLVRSRRFDKLQGPGPRVCKRGTPPPPRATVNFLALAARPCMRLRGETRPRSPALLPSCTRCSAAAVVLPCPCGMGVRHKNVPICIGFCTYFAHRTLGEDYQQLQDQMLRLASKRAQRFKVNLPSQHRSLGAALNSKMGRRRPAQPTSAPSNLGKEPPSTDAENICGIARLSMTAEMPAVGGGPALVDGTPRPPPPPKRSSPRAEHATEMQPLYPPNAATTNALDLVDTW